MLRRATAQPLNVVLISAARIEDIELLRAVAIVFVLIAHAPVLLGHYGVNITAFEHYFNLGSGVDLFLVISGFVITQSFLQHRSDKPNRSARAEAISFWVRRIFRILPAALFWLAAGLLATIVFNRSGQFGHFLENMADALAAALQYANIHQWQCTSNMVVCAKYGVPFGVYWSLSLEEQFYFLFPLVFLFVPKRVLPILLVVIAGIQVFRVKTGLTWWIRSDSLIIGVLIALAKQHSWFAKAEPRFLANPVICAGIFACFTLALGVTSGAASNIVPWHSGLLALVCGAWVFIASYGKGYVAPRLLFNSFVLWVGSLTSLRIVR